MSYISGLGELPGATQPRLVFVPGIMGSQLHDARSHELLWGGDGMIGWAPRMGQWVAALSQGDGIANGGNVVARGFTRFVFPLRTMAQIAAAVASIGAGPLVPLLVRQLGLRDVVIDPYGDALRAFDAQLGAQNVLKFPYDWRLSNDHNAALLKRAIDTRWGASLEDPSRPLTIVAHSMGGLVSRYFIERLGGDRVVRNLVTVGTPHAGAPEAMLVPENVDSLARLFMPIEVAGWLAGTALGPVSPLAVAMPALHAFAGLLRELQTMLLHFSSVFQLLPGFPFVHPTPRDPAEPIATTLNTFRLAMCADAARRNGRLVCTRPLEELSRFGELIRIASGSLPSRVAYHPLISHTLPTTVRCHRINGRLAGVRTACGDGTVPARSAALPRAGNVHNRYLVTSFSHSDLLRDPRVQTLCLNVARGIPAAVPGLSEEVPQCLPVAAVLSQRAQAMRALRVPVPG